MMPQVEPPWWEPLEYFQDSSDKDPRKVRDEGVQEEEVVGMQTAAATAEESAATDAAEYAVRMRAKDQYAHAVPAGVPCGHAILLTGMPRAGSTLQVSRLVVLTCVLLRCRVRPRRYLASASSCGAASKRRSG